MGISWSDAIAKTETHCPTLFSHAPLSRERHAWTIRVVNRITLVRAYDSAFRVVASTAATGAVAAKVTDGQGEVRRGASVTTIATVFANRARSW